MNLNYLNLSLLNPATGEKPLSAWIIVLIVIAAALLLLSLLLPLLPRIKSFIKNLLKK